MCFGTAKKPSPKRRSLEKLRKMATLTGKSRLSFSLINSLLDKGLIQMEGSVRSGKTYARTFAATMSRPEYYAKMVAHTLNDKEIVVFKRTLRLETKKVDGIEDTPEAIMQ